MGINREIINPDPSIRRSAKHLTHVLQRHAMLRRLSYILYRRHNPSEKWVREVPQLAMQLEYTLFRRARSIEEYSNISTLASRLREIITEVNRFKEENAARAHSRSQSNRK